MTITVNTGTFSADGFQPASGLSIPDKARLILKGPTFGGGIVHLCIADSAGTYFRTGRSWSTAIAEVIDMQEVEGRIKLELAGAALPTIGWEIAT